MSSTPPQIGPYQVLAEIGRGGMGIIYRAVQPSLNRVVALKVLQSHFESKPAFVKRFQQEAQTAARMHDDHIVKVWEASTSSPPYYIAMEYLPGGTLADRMTGAPLPLKTALWIVISLASALDHAHRQQVYHRDIKPENIMFNEDGEPVLVDFGIAKAEGNTVTIHGTKLGTAWYMSPEQAKGLPVDARSDLYSLAVLLYQLLTGRVPFNNPDPLVTMRQIIEDPLPDPCALNPALPRRIGDILLRALAKDPRARFQSCGAFARELQGEPEPSGIQRLGKWLHAPRQRSVTIGLLIILVAILGITGFMLAKVGAGPTTQGGGGGKPTSAPVMIKVPATLKMTETEATKLLTACNFTVATTKKPDSTVPQGTVIRSNPTPGQQVAKGSLVKLDISSGKPTISVPIKIKVPATLKMTEAEATKLLTASNLTVTTTKMPDNTVPQGTVIRSDPPTGQQVAKGSLVKLLVSSGSEKKPTCTVPTLAGKKVSEAKENLQRLLLKVGKPILLPHPNMQKDAVIKSFPAAGAVVPQGTTVTLYVSNGIVIKPTYVVPELANKNVKQATELLKQHLAVVKIILVDSTIPKNIVLKSVPAAGIRVSQGAPVILYVSNGPPQSVPDPNEITVSINKFHCPFCPNGYPNKDSLIKHELSGHNWCPYCKTKIGGGEEALKEHLKNTEHLSEQVIKELLP